MRPRPPAVNGMFYPGDPVVLRRLVEEFLAPPETTLTGSPLVVALVAPHAGYVYSGACAGRAHHCWRNASIRRVVLLGRSHRYRFDGAAVLADEDWETPLGIVPTNRELARQVAALAKAGPVQAHYDEHTLEVQLPFLQVALERFTVVGILFGSDTSSDHIAFGERLARLLQPGDAVLASTDLSHYLSLPEAERVDRASIQAVLGNDPRALIGRDRDLCGAPAVAAAMAFAGARGAKWHLVDYRTSADASGDTSRVVGYGAFAATCPGNSEESNHD
ncbi:MAG TPA: AmmeMemoRadiSam system protein B [Candidatus Hydrogenedentes bacterium]|nr:AmmeMemoRadiSam system protein B [Candidatus Hydrogenedentota bacterium]